ncbi:hypothetical protein CI102_5669 [Trichoderma harzianum]|uniref:F-box domain-containing protein n=1 Tax=Trichoderma harzianum CBS 226.95 TaxID=983964 RepID=A0A2T3ZX37_TRIHA|nr:hypothetical protein M431DRAFT_97571 [Trichoderma harzianum CBS 226.95]PKK50479.1 hypothetical protein CI102_5669 [Trichoderma harzianum]PTB49372.1 hypothetical protein M431DRAFT_97571 [Trichoderma harzianum CBS 226.95]
MTLPNLPKELWDQIATYLSGRDVKHLRLACKSLSSIPLHLDRVFISANPIDIKVFRYVANHDGFRHCVREIIWDEARFERDFRVDASSGLEWTDMGYTEDDPPDDFLTECPMEEPLTMCESWWHYRQFLEEQRSVLAEDLDIKAFEYGLDRFPALKRITITPAAHGTLFAPLYKTPMIRTLPYGLNYSIPRGWPVSGESYLPADEWIEENKGKWRGFKEVIRCLAERKAAGVKELVLDTHLLPTGVTCRFFDQPSPEYSHLVDLLQRPGFRRLDLALMAGQQEPGDWESLRNGRLRSALGEAPDLEHFHLNTNIGYHRAKDPGVHHALLHDIFPIERWPKLRHFGLTRFLVSQRDLVSFLSKLPASVRTIELNCLYFISGDGNYRDLLDNMRDSLDWKTRIAVGRPKVTIRLDRLDSGEMDSRTVWLEEEVGNFLYEGGPNPFHQAFRDEVLPGHGGTLRDEFQPELVHPWVDHDTLVLMGIEKESPSVRIEGDD